MIKLKNILNEAKDKTPDFILTSVPASSIPVQYIPKAEVGLGLHMGDKLGRGLTLTNKDYSLYYSGSKVALKLTSNGRMAVRVKSEKTTDYLDTVKKVADDYLTNYASKLASKLKESVNEAKKYDIGSGWMGNGLTIWNRAEQQDDDYKIIAHISDNGTLSIRDKQLPSDIKKMFQIWADSMKKGNRPGAY
jgi:hypothetical protein